MIKPACLGQMVEDKETKFLKTENKQKASKYTVSGYVIKASKIKTVQNEWNGLKFYCAKTVYSDFGLYYSFCTWCDFLLNVFQQQNFFPEIQNHNNSIESGLSILSDDTDELLSIPK